MECKICGGVFEKYGSLNIHIKKEHKQSIKEYYDKYLRKPGEGICPVCGKETNFKNLNLRL